MQEKINTGRYDDFTAGMMLDEWSKEAFFCISVSKTGETKKQESSTYEKFSKIVSDSSISWVNCCIDGVENKVLNIAQSFHFRKELAQDLVWHKLPAYVDVGSELGLLIPAVKVRGLHVTTSPIFVLIKNNLILSIHNRNVTRWIRFFNYAETFMKKIPKNAPQVDKITMVLARLLAKNDEKNSENLRIIEEEGDRVNSMLLDPKAPRTAVGKEIYRTKHALISYLGSLWDSMDVLNSLRYGDSELLSDNPALLHEFNVMATDLTNHISLTEHMSGVLASGLEVLQSIYNNQLQILNNRLALMVTWLTVLGTAVLVPNTLATVFGIPGISEHIGWREVVWLLVGSTIFSAAFAYIVIKKLLPKRID